MAKSPFRFKRSGASPGFQFWKTTVSWQRQIKVALDPFGISHAQFVILAILLWAKEKGASPNQIAIVRRSNLDKMTVSKSLKKLAGLGLVQRAEHELDTRAKSVHLTEKGIALAARLVPVVEGVDAAFFGVLPPASIKNLLEILSRISSATETE